MNANEIKQLLTEYLHPLELREGADTCTLNENELTLFNLAIDEAVNNLYENGNVVFKLDELKKAIFKDQRIQQTKHFSDNIDYVLSRYNRVGKKGNQLLHWGDKKLDLYTTRKAVNLEIQIIDYLNNAQNSEYVKIKLEHINNELERTAIDDNGKEYKLYGSMSEEQKRGVFACTHVNSIASYLQGFAGAGKSWTVGAISRIYKANKFNVIGVALSNNAASVLARESGMKCYTVANILRLLGSKQIVLNEPTVIIVDEAGLVGLEDTCELLKWVSEAKAPVKIIYSGDDTQLNPIKSPNALGLISQLLPDEAKQTLSIIRRQKSQSHVEAVHSFREGKAGEGIYAYWEQEAVKLVNNNKEVLNSVVSDYFKSMLSDKDLSRLILCGDNNMVSKLNAFIHSQMKLFGKVDTNEQTIVVKDKNKDNLAGTKEITISVGDHIMFTVNKSNIPLINSETNQIYNKNTFIINRLQGIITDIKGDLNDGFDITVDIPATEADIDGKINYTHVKFNTKRDNSVNGYPHLDGGDGATGFDLNYAVTIYSSQGQTVDEVFFINNQQIDRRNMYVAMSRHKRNCKIYLNKENLFNKDTPEQRRSKTIFDAINKACEGWSKNQEADSIICKIQSEHRMLKESAFKLNIPLDVNNVDKQIIELKKETEYEIKYQLAHQFSQVMETKSGKIIDCAEYYVNKPLELDKEKTVDNNFHFIKHKEYPVHEMIDEDFFNKYNNHLIKIGSGSELRIIADEYSSYNIFGYDSKGIGYPVMAHNGNQSANAPILIIEDLNLYLEYLKTLYLDSNNHDNEKPTIIWGARDNDYAHIFNSLNGRTIELIGGDSFKYKTFFKITHAKAASPIQAEFLNINKSIIDKYYLPQKTAEGMTKKAVRKMNIDSERYGDYVLPEMLDNIKYGNPKWNNIMFSCTPNRLSKDNALQYKRTKENNFIQDNGLFHQEFIEKYVIKNNLLSKQRFETEVKPRNQKLLNLINKDEETQVSNHQNTEPFTNNTQPIENVEPQEPVKSKTIMNKISSMFR